MGEHKFTKHSAEPKNDGADTSREMMVRMEVGFYQGWCELMQVAFKKDGMMGVLGLASEIVNLGSAMAMEAEKQSPGCTNLHRSTIAAYLTNEWYEQALKAVRSLPEGDWYFELKRGGKTDYPKPGDELTTFSDTLKLREETTKVYEDWKRLQDSNPGAAKELVNIFAATHRL